MAAPIQLNIGEEGKKSPVEQRVLPEPMEVLGKEGNQLNKASCDLKGTNNTLCSFK